MFFNKPPARRAILDILDAIVPESQKVGQNMGLVQAGILETVDIGPKAPALVRVTLAITPDQQGQAETWVIQADKAIKALKGVGKVQIILTAHESTPNAHAPKSATPKQAAPSAPQQTPERPRGQSLRPKGLSDVKLVLAVASAKGGVGKSTLCVNIAKAFADQGLKVGLLDLDMHGPSLPTLMGTKGQKPAQINKRLEPILAHGLATMSIGYLVEESAAMIWRGAMVSGAIKQMVEDVNWGQLDILLLDTPPGTGDALLTIAQSIPIDGVLVVSTPQDVALADVRRGLSLFEKTKVPVLGLVENMAFITLPDGQKFELFGPPKTEQAARALNVPFLGQVGMDQALQSGDMPAPPLGAKNIAIATLADNVWAALKNHTQKPAPIITFHEARA